jgi:hypothetical protein
MAGEGNEDAGDRERTMTMKKISLPLRGYDNPIDVDADRILCNDIVLPCDASYKQKTKLWVISNEFGPMGAVWADNQDNALDQLVDSDLAQGMLVDEATLADMDDDARAGLAHLGNAGEACDLTNVELESVAFKPADWALMCKFAEARGAGLDRLGDL